MAANLGDALRMHKARQALKGERDRLLKFADKRHDLARYLKSDDGKDRARVILITTAFSILGMIPYVSTMLLWFLKFHDSFAQSVVGFFALFSIGILLCAGSTRKALGKDRPWMWWFGVVWLQAFAVGLILGFFLYFRLLAYYIKYEEMRTYTNVAAAQPSDAFGDGSMFLFTEDTRLDALRAVGFKSKWTGETYCVAPLVDVTMNQASDIHYWAVGMNCCPSRAEFHCGDAEDGLTRSALRVLEPEDVAVSWLQWALRSSVYPKYMDAISLQIATYYTKASRRPTLVHWSKNPIALKESYHYTAQEQCIRLSLIYFCMVALACLFIAWHLIPKKRPPTNLREV